MFVSAGKRAISATLATLLLAGQLMAGESNCQQQIRAAFRRIVGRWPRANEVKILARLHHRQLSVFQADPDAAESLLNVGASSTESRGEPARHAALTFVISLIFNLNEAIVKQ